MASIIASCLDQQNMEFNGFKESAQKPYGFLGVDDVHQMLRNNGEGNQLVKDAKMEGNGNKLDWKTNDNDQNYNEEMKFSSDLPFMWNSSAAWLDSSNIGSSFHSIRWWEELLPTDFDEHPKIYRMKLWATNQVRAKSKFWDIKLNKGVKLYRVGGQNVRLF